MTRVGEALVTDTPGATITFDAGPLLDKRLDPDNLSGEADRLAGAIDLTIVGDRDKPFDRDEDGDRDGDRDKPFDRDGDGDRDGDRDKPFDRDGDRDKPFDRGEDLEGSLSLVALLLDTYLSPVLLSVQKQVLSVTVSIISDALFCR